MPRPPCPPAFLPLNSLFPLGSVYFLLAVIAFLIGAIGLSGALAESAGFLNVYAYFVACVACMLVTANIMGWVVLPESEEKLRTLWLGLMDSGRVLDSPPPPLAASPHGILNWTTPTSPPSFTHGERLGVYLLAPPPGVVFLVDCVQAYGKCCGGEMGPSDWEDRVWAGPAIVDAAHPPASCTAWNGPDGKNAAHTPTNLC